MKIFSVSRHFFHFLVIFSCLFVLKASRVSPVQAAGGEAVRVIRSVDSPGPIALQLEEPCSPVPLGTGLAGSFPAAGATECYTFNGTAGDKILVRAWSSSASLAGNRKASHAILGPDGSILCPEVNTVERNCELTTSGTHTLLVIDSYPSVGGPDYSVYLQRLNAPLGCTVISYDSTYAGTAPETNGANCYTFSGEIDDRVLLRMLVSIEGGIFYLAPSLNYYAPDGTLVCEESFSSAILDSYCTLHVQGTYVVLFSLPYDPSQLAAPTYKFYFQRTNNPVNAQPVSSGQTVIGTIDVSPGMEVYSFQGEAGDFLIASIMGTSGSLLSEMRVYDENGDLLCSEYSQYPTSPGLEIDCRLDSDSTYFIFAYGYPFSTGTYDLNVNFGKWYLGHHSPAPISWASDGPIQIKLSDDYSRILEIRGDPFCFRGQTARFRLNPLSPLPVADHQFLALALPVDIPGSTFSIDMDGRFFDTNNDGKPDQVHGGFIFHSGSDVCSMTWDATNLRPDSDYDGWRDGAEEALGSSASQLGSTPEDPIVPATTLAGVSTCEDFLDNDLDGQMDSSDPGCPVKPGVSVVLQTIGPARVSPGQTITYIIKYANAGLEDAKGVVIVDKLPHEAKYISSTNNGSYNIGSHQVFWQLSNIPSRGYGELAVEVTIKPGLMQDASFANLAYTADERPTLLADPSISVDYQVLEYSQNLLRIRGDVFNRIDTGLLNVEITSEGSLVLVEPAFSYTKAAENVAIRGSIAQEKIVQPPMIDLSLQPGIHQFLDPGPLDDGPYDLIKISEDLNSRTEKIIELSQDFYGYFQAKMDSQPFIDCMAQRNLLTSEQAASLSDTYTAVAVIQGMLRGMGELMERNPVLKAIWGDRLLKLTDQFLKDVEVLIGGAIYENTVGPLSENWFGNPAEAQKAYDAYLNAYKSCFGANVSTATVLIAHDPNAKLVDTRIARPGDPLGFTVEYENVGEGTAYGVYIVDTLDPDLDDSTLSFPSTLPPLVGSYSYNPQNRTIIWYVGELGPGIGGQLPYSIQVRADAPPDYLVTNYATVYFPSVPEKTNTNGVTVQNCYSLTLNTGNFVHGSITTDPPPNCPDGVRYLGGTNVTFSANPEFGYEFTQWKDGATGTSNPLTVEMVQDRTIAADFQLTSSPEIGFTYVPPYGTPLYPAGGADILIGQVLNAAPANHHIVCYIYVPLSLPYGENGWWIKPYNSVYNNSNLWETPIHDDQTWGCDITTGGYDPYATVIEAYLVPNAGKLSSAPTRAWLSTHAIAMAAATRQPADTAPTVLKSTLASTNPSSAQSVVFTVSFSEPVTGVDHAPPFHDFALTTTGITNASITSVSGTGSSYTVTVSTGTGNGTIRLDVMDNNSIIDAAGNFLGGIAMGDGVFTSGETYTIIKTSTFADVPLDYWAWNYIERLFKAGITSGCGTNPLAYCPTTPVTRDQMAVFLLKGKHGSSYTPPLTTGVFTDVPADYWSAAWIEQLAAEGITSGCSVSPKQYCPATPVTRDQMAVFLLKARHGTSYAPPPPSGVFLDVPTNHWAAAWIEQLAAEGITSGCGSGNYCPDTPVTRDQMAVFLVRNFNLP